MALIINYWLVVSSYNELPTHAIYLSLTEIELTESKTNLRLKVFSDDLRDVLKNHNAIDYQPAELSAYLALNEALVQDYFEQYLVLEVNGTKTAQHLTGYEIEGDAHFIDFESELPDDISEISITASFFMELFPTQMNVVNVKKDGQTQYLKFSHPALPQILTY